MTNLLLLVLLSVIADKAYVQFEKILTLPIFWALDLIPNKNAQLSGQNLLLIRFCALQDCAIEHACDL